MTDAERIAALRKALEEIALLGRSYIVTNLGAHQCARRAEHALHADTPTA